MKDDLARDDMLDIPGIAALLGIAPHWAWEKVCRGDFGPIIRKGRRIYVSRAVAAARLAAEVKPLEDQIARRRRAAVEITDSQPFPFLMTTTEERDPVLEEFARASAKRLRDERRRLKAGISPDLADEARSSSLAQEKAKVWMVTWDGDAGEVYFYSYDPAIYLADRPATITLGTFVPDETNAEESTDVRS